MAESISQKIVSLEELVALLAPRRSAGERVVQCHGCFDVVHPGHIRHLADSASQGDILIVSVTADPQVRKATDGPFIPQELRCENLAALSMVDFVLVDTEAWAGPVLERLRPDVYCKGLEYSTNNDPRFLKEKEIVERYGGVVVYTSGEVVYSSTRLQADYLDRGDLHDSRVRTLVARHQLTRQRLLDRLARFADASVLVVGDILIDRYVECEQGEVTAEAPVLQVTPISERTYLGGAGVLALHAASLGAKVRFVGVLDPALSDAPWDVVDQLRSRGVEVSAVPGEGRLEKTRYLVDGQKVFKVNHGRPMTISSAQESAWLANVERSLKAGAKGVIAVDYGYGSLNRPRMRRLAQSVEKHGATLFGDVSSTRTASLGKFFGLHCDLICPNESEVRAYLGDPESGLPLLASKIFAHAMTDALALTLGARGVVLFDRERQANEVDGIDRYLPEYLPALARHAVDPLGAGDALTCVASLARLQGANLIEAAFLGSAAAALVVERLGNEPIGLDPLLRFLNSYPLLQR